MPFTPRATCLQKGSEDTQATSYRLGRGIGIPSTRRVLPLLQMRLQPDGGVSLSNRLQETFYTNRKGRVYSCLPP